MQHYSDVWGDREIKGYEKLILIYLMENYSETDGYSHPTRKQIEEDTGIAKNTLSKTLDSLIAKGYIIRARNPHKGGKNNIYYIHKYLVASKKDTPAEAKPSENERKPCETDAKASTNELLVIQNCKLTKRLTKEDIVELNKMDTDRLLQAINQANKKQGDNAYHINYIKKAYSNIENNHSEPQREAQSNKPINNSNDSNKSDTGATGEYHNNNYPVRTKYHGSFNEHFRKYTEDELEANLLKAQAEKRKGLAQWRQDKKYTTKQEKW